MDNEIERLKREVERLQKALEAKQQVSVASPALINNHELIEDLARYQEGLWTQQQVKKRWREVIDEKTWNELGSDDELVRAIEARRVQRVRSGAFKRELAQKHIIKAPDILEKIMSDDSANARHRVDSIKALDALADPGPQTAPPSLSRDPFRRAPTEQTLAQGHLGLQPRPMGRKPYACRTQCRPLAQKTGCRGHRDPRGEASVMPFPKVKRHDLASRFNCEA